MHTTATQSKHGSIARRVNAGARLALLAVSLLACRASPLSGQNPLGARVKGGRLEVMDLSTNKVMRSWSSREGGMLQLAGISPDGAHVATIEWSAAPVGAGYPRGTLTISDPVSGQVIARVPGAVAAAWLGDRWLIAVLGEYAETEYSYVGHSLARVRLTGETHAVDGCQSPKAPRSATAVEEVFVMCTTSEGLRRAFRIPSGGDGAQETPLLSSEISPSGRFAIVRRDAAESTYIQDGSPSVTPHQSVLAPDHEPIGWTSAGGDILILRPGIRRPRLAPRTADQPPSRVTIRANRGVAAEAEYELRDVRTGTLRRRFRGALSPIMTPGGPAFTVNGRLLLATRLANPN